jgi:hypothetical protein
LRSNRAKLTGVTGAMLVLAGMATLDGCKRIGNTGPPPHSTRRMAPPAVSSSLAVPVVADLTQLERLLDHEIPVDLWTIDQPDATCVAPHHVNLFGTRLAITPEMHCHISGTVVRGDIALRGDGRTIIADVPILAHVDARNIGGLVNTHADGTAMAHARINLTVARDWRVGGTLLLGYDWTTPPAITLLGQRITFTDKADERLKPIIARLTQRLPAVLAGLDVRTRIGGLWQRGFAVINLNDRNPPVWMRIVPQSLSYGGYTIVGHQLQLRLGMVALTQAVVGARPADPAPTPLPDTTDAPAGDGRIHMFVPVSADYAELVPVIARALTRRSARPFVLPGIGAVTARFANIEVYGATDGRIAVGADIAAVAQNGALPETRGRIWFAGQPHNAPGSQLVRFTNLSVSGATTDMRGDVLLAVANSPGFSDAVAQALTQNFTHDYDTLEDKIRRAIAHRVQGNLGIEAQLENTRNGEIEAYADGLYMPVWITGRASVTVVPAVQP